MLFRSEFAVPTEHTEDIVKSEPSEKQEVIKQEASPPPQLSTSAPSVSNGSDSVKIAQPSTTAKETASQSPTTNAAPTTSQVPVYTSPTTQQIPTYQERQESDYADMTQPRNDSGYPPLDRPVRPSEMKEEG